MMIFKTLLLYGLLFFAIGCGSDDEPKITEIYIGTLEFDNDPQTIGQHFTDTVKLTITGTSFSFITEVHTVSNDPKLCNVSGTITGFGGTAAIFSPELVDSTSCNSRDVLRGTFISVFSGDSLFFNKMDTVNNLFYELRLGK